MHRPARHPHAIVAAGCYQQGDAVPCPPSPVDVSAHIWGPVAMLASQPAGVVHPVLASAIKPSVISPEYLDPGTTGPHSLQMV